MKPPTEQILWQTCILHMRKASQFDRIVGESTEARRVIIVPRLYLAVFRNMKGEKKQITRILRGRECELCDLILTNPTPRMLQIDWTKARLLRVGQTPHIRLIVPTHLRAYTVAVYNNSSPDIGVFILRDNYRVTAVRDATPDELPTILHLFQTLPPEDDTL